MIGFLEMVLWWTQDEQQNHQDQLLSINLDNFEPIFGGGKKYSLNGMNLFKDRLQIFRNIFKGIFFDFFGNSIP